MWKLDASERIVHWKAFRKTLDGLPLPDALDAVAHFWQNSPFVPYYLDQEASNAWPDPWTLIYDNTYCDLAKCLGIVYTVTLTEHRDSVDSEIRVYKDTETGHEYNLAYFNQGKYILNMIDGEVVNNTQIKNTLQLIQRYNSAELQLENY